MGNFFDAPVFDKDDEAPKVWHVVAALAIIWFLNHLRAFIVHRYRLMGNKAAAKKMLAERNGKSFSFGEVDKELGEMLLTLDVHQIREKLMAGGVSSEQLVEHFGQRCYTIGRDLCLSTEELFDSARELAKKCDQER